MLTVLWKSLFFYPLLFLHCLTIIQIMTSPLTHSRIQNYITLSIPLVCSLISYQSPTLLIFKNFLWTPKLPLTTSYINLHSWLFTAFSLSRLPLYSLPVIFHLYCLQVLLLFVLSPVPPCISVSSLKLTIFSLAHLAAFKIFSKEIFSVCGIGHCALCL